MLKPGIIALALASSLAAGCGKSVEGGGAPAALTADQKVARGKYILTIGGCTDCHTPGVLIGQKPKAGEEYTGTNLGLRGPWGTSYPSNLRKSAQVYTEETFVRTMKSAKAGTGLPPMPWDALAAMTSEDLAAVHAYLRSLGDAGDPAPMPVPPTREPTTPYLDFTPKNMPAAPRTP